MNTRLDYDGDIAWLTMDDGKVNALGESLLGEIAARLDEAAGRAKVTVFQGRTGIFSAGFDLGAFAGGAEAAVAMLRAGADLIVQMLSHPHPVVAGCTGHAYPMGAFLLLSSDRRFGVEGPFRLGMNEVPIGLTVPRFALALARDRLTAPGFAAVSTGTMWSPEAAVRAGYLDEVVPTDELEPALAASAAELLQIDARAYRGTKERMHAPLLATLRYEGSLERLESEVAEAATSPSG